MKFEEYLYLKEGIDNEDMSTLFAVQGIIRTSDLNVEDDFDFSKFDEFKSLLGSRPEVLQRPVLIHNGQAVIGRPPEEILILLP